MAKKVRKFVDRAFSKTVDLDLLRRLLAPYAGRIAFDWQTLPDDQAAKREAIFELFKEADGRFPEELQFTLFNICTLSTDAGARILQGQADERGIELVPRAETEGRADGRHLNPRHLALRAWLDHRALFDRALDIAAFWSHSAPLELAGAREGAESRHHDEHARAAFADSLSTYFSGRYQGRYCDVRWYGEEESVRILVLHGAKPDTKNVERDGAEETLTFREITQDTIQYDTIRGNVSIGAKSVPDARKLAALFAEHLLGDREFFSGAEAANLYTLEPINRHGADFEFNFEWDETVTDVCIREVQVDEGEHRVGGRVRYSPWAMTMRDSRNALRRVAEIAPEADFADLRINHVKLDFWLDVDGKDTRVRVKVKPPGMASFRDHSHERTIMEHLERNGIRRLPAPLSAAAAAE